MRLVLSILVLCGACRTPDDIDGPGARFNAPSAERVQIDHGDIVLQAEFWGVPDDAVPVVGLEVEYTHGLVRGAFAQDRPGFLGLDCSALAGDYVCSASVPMNWLYSCSAGESHHPELGAPLGTRFTAHVAPRSDGDWIASTVLDDTGRLALEVLTSEAQASGPVHLEITP